ncbi:hypothetical protein BDP27DRAFT_1367104 [Rhodocollybia butyracea]|uniref:Uncharacterized protein n=1 Tax=Rhodocollybia butyracea TaxID=206335 RepID=A0A9P5PMA9_9AGAR|nr:hypothetical protein BDP27DRAFT_1367104 [Rhodocollybia butyracea]
MSNMLYFKRNEQWMLHDPNPNPTTDMLKSYFVKGTYKIEFKFGDGAEANSPRHKAYSTSNPNFKFEYVMDGSVKRYGKSIETHILKGRALSNQSPKVVIRNGVDNFCQSKAQSGIPYFLGPDWLKFN